jgi:nucleotide-binding universal stress UspA family protein
MTKITHVLCPIDFSEFSRRALDHAAAIARWYKASLTVLYVFPVRLAVELPPMATSDQDRQRTLADIEQFIKHVPTEIRLEARVEESSSVHEEILRHAEGSGADLLVVGSHGRSGFERLLLGSVTERLVHKALCPTMVVPRRAPDKDPDEPVQFHRILCPVDFSETSNRALAYAMSLAEEAAAHLTVVNVIEVPPELREHSFRQGIDVDRIRCGSRGGLPAALATADSRRGAEAMHGGDGRQRRHGVRGDSEARHGGPRRPDRNGCARPRRRRPAGVRVEYRTRDPRRRLPGPYRAGLASACSASRCGQPSRRQ